MKLPRGGYGLHIAQTDNFPLPLHLSNSGIASDSDEEDIIHTSASPVICAACSQTSIGGNSAAASSLSKCNYCERAFHPRCVHCLDNSFANKPFQSWACPFCAKKAIKEYGVRVTVDRQGHHVPTAKASKAPTKAQPGAKPPSRSSRKRAAPSDTVNGGEAKRSANGTKSTSKATAKVTSKAAAKVTSKATSKATSTTKKATTASSKTTSKGKTKTARKPKKLSAKATLDAISKNPQRPKIVLQKRINAKPAKASKSVARRFRESNCRDEFERPIKLQNVTITQLPLGIGFDTRSGPHYLSIHHFNPGRDGKMKFAQRLLEVGDQLVVVGDTEVQNLPFASVVKLLKETPIPMRLQFLRTQTAIAPVPCWHSFVYEAACAKGPDVGLGEIFDLATKLAKKAKTSAQKIAQMAADDVAAARQLLCSQSCCKLSHSLFSVRVPFSAYHPKHGTTSNPAVSGIPISLRDLRVVGDAPSSEDSESASKDGNGNGTSSGNKVDLAMLKKQVRTAIIDDEDRTRCPACYRPILDTTNGRALYTQCPSCKAIMQRPVSNEDVVLNNMVSFLKLQQPVPLQQKLIKQTVEQTARQVEFYDSEIRRLQKKKEEAVTKWNAAKALAETVAAGDQSEISWATLKKLSRQP